MGKKKNVKRLGKYGVKNRGAAGRRQKRIKIFLVAGAVLLVLALFLLLGNGANENGTVDPGEAQEGEQPKPVVSIEMENGAIIKVELDPVNAPNTVRNFIALAEDGFYDGLIFHRVIPGFMIQGGCPDGTGLGGPDYAIRGEFSNNGHQNNLLHHRGVISMARTEAPDSAGSQFFITVADQPFLDGDYAAFGVVIEGMEEADRIAAVQRDQTDRPLDEQRIRRVSVEKFGVVYDPPEKI